MDRLDGIDEQILAELAQHARATFAEIGERVNLSASAVKRRVDRMLDSGVIRGFTTVIDRSAVTADAILRVLARDMRHLEDALERIRTSADIERTESIVVLSNLIDRSPAEG